LGTFKERHFLRTVNCFALHRIGGFGAINVIPVLLICKPEGAENRYSAAFYPANAFRKKANSQSTIIFQLQRTLLI
jgi:hypothetical protein